MFLLLGKVKVNVTQLCLTLCDPPGLYSPWNSLGQNTGVGSLSLLQRIFLAQGSNPGLPHCRWIFFNQLSHKGSPRIQEWVAYPFSSRSSQPRNQTRVSCIAGRFFTIWAMREATLLKIQHNFPSLLESWSSEQFFWITSWKPSHWKLPIAHDLTISELEKAVNPLATSSSPASGWKDPSLIHLPWRGFSQSSFSKAMLDIM